MVQEYYLLVSNYQQQDTAVLIGLAFALLVCAGWPLVRWFKYPWLEKLYVAQFILIWVGILFLFSPTAAPLINR
jgi:hypothetical protein